jgi:hypothetical protein
MVPRDKVELRRLQMRRRRVARSRRISAIAGGILLGLAGLWLIWLMTHHGSGPSLLPTIPGYTPPVAQVPPLLVAGVTLGHADQAPALNQQQALIIASELEPDAAARAKKVGAQYIMLNYTPTSSSLPHPGISNTPAWLILYQGIPVAAGDTSADPAAASTSSRDLYVFIDAKSGKELLVIWA